MSTFHRSDESVSKVSEEESKDVAVGELIQSRDLFNDTLSREQITKLIQTHPESLYRYRSSVEIFLALGGTLEAREYLHDLLSSPHQASLHGIEAFKLQQENKIDFLHVQTRDLDQNPELVALRFL